MLQVGSPPPHAPDWEARLLYCLAIVARMLEAQQRHYPEAYVSGTIQVEQRLVRITPFDTSDWDALPPSVVWTMDQATQVQRPAGLDEGGSHLERVEALGLKMRVLPRKDSDG